ncbi:MAG: ABC transporter ATP-binding protein [SAR324 cluster bacterium]|uniref:ABC transporter ATP-binding protein n=1 Tax=SAR324 cluster bacterium TaxID=2024889 RepID=A0A432G396_9DELT|nr:MAG: ABC transporter ATP-binding protein [SAR324 cluster bacterium]
MLELKHLETSYGQSQVLFGVDLQVNEGEVVTLLGRNGMGKTTTINSIMGLVRARSGEIKFEGSQIREWPAHRVAQSGMGLVPEGRQIFPNLNVIENLIATSANRFKNKNPWTLDRVFNLFPRLLERAKNMGNQLSGGEQQMLAIGRALMTNPRLLILDEATEGLAPLVKMEIWECLKGLKTSGQSILVVDKNIEALTHLANRHYIMEKGEIVWSGDSPALIADKEIKHRYLGI